VGFLERDFDHDHLAEKSNWTKMGQKIHFILQNLLDRPHCATIQAALSAVALQPMIIIVYGSILAPPSLNPRKKPES
jgi:hypothetical protein